MQSHRIVRAATLALSLVAISHRCDAGAFDPKLVSGQAKFVAFVDVEAGRNTAVGERILQQIIDDPGYQEMERVLTENAGFMPATDINDITFYGDVYEQDPKGVLVMRALINTASLRNALSLARKFEVFGHGGHEYMSWLDDKTDKPIYACIYDPKTIIMAGDQAKLCAAIDVVDAPEKSAFDQKAMAVPTVEGMWAFVIGRDVGSSPAASGNMVLSQLVRISVALSQSKDQTLVTATGAVDGSAKAGQLFDFVNGLRALGSFVGSPNTAEKIANAALVREISAATQVARDGNAVAVTLTLSNDRAVQIVEEAIARRENDTANPAGNK